LAEQLERYRWLIVALLAVPLLSGVAYLVSQRVDQPAPLQVVTGQTGVPGDIRVYVTGAVRNPGVYALPEGSRWIDAVQAAGGATSEADLNAINLARRVQDEDQITVPLLGSVAVAGATQNPRININTASAAELETLPGIGPVRAANIVRSRSEEGLFTSIDDLAARKLVPESVLKDIADLITTGP